MLRFKLINPRTNLGQLPELLSEDDPRPAALQLAEACPRGGRAPAWPFQFDPSTRQLCQPGDKPISPLAEAKLRDEVLLFYECAWLCIVQPDGAFEARRW